MWLDSPMSPATRSGEIRKLSWSHLEADAIRVPGAITKSGEAVQIALSEEIKDILARRRSDRRPGRDLIFHRNGKPIKDYRDCWISACVCLGLGAYYCRTCRDAEGNYLSKLDADRKCAMCGRSSSRKAKYIGQLFHDFRRSAADEGWKAGSSIDECKEITGHRSDAMFKRYADLFSDEERRERQRSAQDKRREWKKAQADKVVVMPRHTVAK